MAVRMLTSGRLMDTRIFTAKNLLTILLVSAVLFFTFYMRLNISSEFAYINVLFYLAIIGLTISMRGRLSVLGMGTWAILVVANSKSHEDFVLSYQPELKGKTTNILLGVDRFKQMESSARTDSETVIAVAGGNRLIKGNDVVLEACRILRSRGTNAFLDVYGSIYEIDDPRCTAIKTLPRSLGRVMGQVDHRIFLEGLNRSSLFVMDSRHESFGLSALDALRTGCSVLISKDCGVLEALSPKGSDVIKDCENAEEVAEKMAYLLEHSNAKRLYESIDFDAMSWDVQVGKLRDMCVEVAARKGGAR